MGPRRTLQLSLVVAAIAVLVLALTGVLSSTGASPVENTGSVPAAFSAN